MASQSQITEFTQGISNFASEFYKECAESKPGDVIVSPLSVASALALLSQGLYRNQYTFYEQRIKNIRVPYHQIYRTIK